MVRRIEEDRGEESFVLFCERYLDTGATRQQLRAAYCMIKGVRRASAMFREMKLTTRQAAERFRRFSDQIQEFYKNGKGKKEGEEEGDAAADAETGFSHSGGHPDV